VGPQQDVAELIGDVRGDGLSQNGADGRVGDQLSLPDRLIAHQPWYGAERFSNDAFVQQDGSGGDVAFSAAHLFLGFGRQSSP
jgi:hypothetical protein